MAKEDFVRTLEPYFVKRDEFDPFWWYNNPANLLQNGDFETWTAGSAVGDEPDGWTESGVGDVQRESATVKRCQRSAELTHPGGAGGSTLYQAASCSSFYRGMYVALSAWVYADDADRVRLSIADGVTTTYSDYHPGDGSWVLLTVVKLIDAANNQVTVAFRIEAGAGAVTAWVDAVHLCFSQVPRGFAERAIYDDGTVTIEGGVITKNVQQGAGDPKQCYQVGGTPMAVTGVDTSDGNKFKIAMGTCTLGTAADAIVIDTSKGVYINDNENVDMTIGLTINQGANDDEIVALKSSDVAHGMTGIAEADTYYFIRKHQAGAGGTLLYGLKDAEAGSNATSLSLRGLKDGAADTTKTAAGVGLVTVDGMIRNGTGEGAPGANGNVFVVRSLYSARFIVDAEGDLFADGGIASTNMVTLYDKYEDAHLLRAFDLARSRGRGIIRSKFDKWLKYDEDKLVELGILGDKVENGGLINVTRLQQLLCGAAWQAYQDRQSMKQILKSITSKVLPLLSQPENEELQSEFRALENSFSCSGVL